MGHLFLMKMITNVNLKHLLKYFKGTTTSAFNVLLSGGVLPIIFVLYSKDLHVAAVLLFILWLALSFLFSSSFISSL